MNETLAFASPVQIRRENPGSSKRGRPLIMLGVLTGSWVIVRLAMWETPLPQVPRAIGTMSSQIFAQGSGDEAADQIPSPKGSAAQSGSERGSAQPVSNDAAYRLLYSSYNQQTELQERGARNSLSAPLMLPRDAPFLPPASQSEAQSDLQTGVSHQLMWMAAMAYMPVPKSVRAALSAPSQQEVFASQTRPVPFEMTRAQEADRWSLDAWAFWRQGSGTAPFAASGRLPNYGGSQAGAVLRYELKPDNARRPRAYMRAYSSIEGRTEQEMAAGLSARPLPKLPLRVHVEARALHVSGDVAPRAAAFVTTELPPARLPAGFSAEAYGQAGYVAGRNATAFADGQAHVLREVASFDLAKVTVGAAAFAGAQKGVHRVDIGPAMRVEMKLGETPARLSASYRAKVAGDAQPSSGLAVTLSTRF